MDEKEINSKIGQGYLWVRAILEIVGKPKEYVEETIKGHLKNIKANKNKFIIVTEKIVPPEEHDNFFSSFCEIELLVKNIQELLYFCFDYMPSSIEIMKPEQIILKNNDYVSFLNDLQGRLHAVNASAIELKENNYRHVRNTAVLLRNFIVVLLSKKPMQVEEMHAYVGVKDEDIKKVLEVLIKERKVKKQGNIYSVIPK